jgi:hypothetical protein
MSLYSRSIVIIKRKIFRQVVYKEEGAEGGRYKGAGYLPRLVITGPDQQRMSGMKVAGKSARHRDNKEIAY